MLPRTPILRFKKEGCRLLARNCSDGASESLGQKNGPRRDMRMTGFIVTGFRSGPTMVVVLVFMLLPSISTHIANEWQPAMLSFLQLKMALQNACWLPRAKSLSELSLSLSLGLGGVEHAQELNSLQAVLTKLSALNLGLSLQDF